jgi:hypothetical protein
MRDRWYGDHRDLVKWGTLLELAGRFHAKHILQVLYYRTSQWSQIEVGGTSVDIAPEVIQHFRNVNSIRKLRCSFPIEVLNEEFGDRGNYLQTVTSVIRARAARPGIVFLDPDTGLEPPSGNYGPTHVLNCELRSIWGALSSGDVLVFYQHETNKNGDPWIQPKLDQFANALGIRPDQAKSARGPMIARDVAFFFAEKA